MASPTIRLWYKRCNMKNKTSRKREKSLHLLLIFTSEAALWSTPPFLDYDNGSALSHCVTHYPMAAHQLPACIRISCIHAKNLEWESQVQLSFKQHLRLKPQVFTRKWWPTSRHFLKWETERADGINYINVSYIMHSYRFACYGYPGNAASPGMFLKETTPTLWGCFTCTQNPNSFRTLRSALIIWFFKLTYSWSSIRGTGFLVCERKQVFQIAAHTEME